MTIVDLKVLDVFHLVVMQVLVVLDGWPLEVWGRDVFGDKFWLIHFVVGRDIGNITGRLIPNLFRSVVPRHVLGEEGLPWVEAVNIIAVQPNVLHVLSFDAPDCMTSDE